jgi:hypothetical protein
MEKFSTDKQKKPDPVLEKNAQTDENLTPEEKVIKYCKQFGDFKEEQLRKKMTGEFEFTQRMPNSKTGIIYLFDKFGRIKDMSAMHNIKTISTEFGRIRPPESRANKLDA